jgi:hypothetical protein
MDGACSTHWRDKCIQFLVGTHKGNKHLLDIGFHSRIFIKVNLIGIGCGVDSSGSW